MPRGDKTGPEGMGPLTGRKMGYCTVAETDGFMGSGRFHGRGFRFGCGGGRGFGRGSRYQQEYPKSKQQVSEKAIIENEIRVLKDQLSSLDDKLAKTKEE